MTKALLSQTLGWIVSSGAEWAQRHNPPLFRKNVPNSGQSQSISKKMCLEIVLRNSSFESLNAFEELELSGKLDGERHDFLSSDEEEITVILSFRRALTK